MKRVSIIILLVVAMTILMTGCGKSEITIVTTEDFSVEVEATNGEDAGGIGYVNIEEGEVFCAETSIEGDKGEFNVKVYPADAINQDMDIEVEDAEDLDELEPDEYSMVADMTLMGGTQSVDLDSGEYLVYVEADGKVTGTLTLSGKPASEVQ